MEPGLVAYAHAVVTPYSEFPARQLSAVVRTCRRSTWACSATPSGLAAFLKHEVSSWPRRLQAAFVGTYEELACAGGAPTGAAGSALWAMTLPQQRAALAATLPPVERFGAFILDEAQDFADLRWSLCCIAPGVLLWRARPPSAGSSTTSGLG